MTSPEASAPAPSVVLVPVSPCDVFDPSIEGVEPITSEGTPVPAELVRAVRACAKKHAIKLRRA